VEVIEQERTNIKHGQTALNERDWHCTRIDKDVNVDEDRGKRPRRSTTWWDPTNTIGSGRGDGTEQGQR
jgi:hypothetical protein